MKKFYLLAFSLVLGISGLSQTTISSTLEDSKGPRGEMMRHSSNHDRATPFWEEDFANGFPATWWVVDSSGICPWRYTHDGSWGFYSDNGETQGDPAMNSTTASNGYLICDNDSANHVNYGQPSGTTYNYLSSWFCTEAINCGTHSSVILTFEQSFRYNNGVPLIVRVSNDSVNWTTYDVSGGVPNNTASDDPDFVTLNISSVAANQSTVYLRFGWDARVYYWSIDDIALSEADANDVSIDNGFWESGNYGIQQWKIPLGQASPLTFRGGLYNFTGTTMTDAYYDVAVDNTSGSQFSGTSAFLSLTPGQLDTANVSTTWTPTEVDTHSVVFTAAVNGQTDANLANNTLNEELVITDFVYGMDNLDAANNGVTGTIANWNGNSNNPFGIGNFYEVMNSDDIVQIQMGISSAAANEGLSVFGEIFQYDGSTYNSIGTTADYILTASDLGTIITLDLPVPVGVLTGDLLLITVNHYGGSDDARFWVAQPVPQGLVRGYDSNYDWYTLINPEAVVVRAVFDNPSAGQIELSDGKVISVYPNPAKNDATVSVTLLTEETVSVEMTDLNGKLVYSNTPQNLKEGQHNILLNLEGFAAGVYTVKVKVGDDFELKKLIIQ